MELAEYQNMVCDCIRDKRKRGLLSLWDVHTSSLFLVYYSVTNFVNTYHVWENNESCRQFYITKILVYRLILINISVITMRYV